MKRKIIYSLIVILLIIGGARVIYSFFTDNGDVAYKFSQITTTSLENTISATGILSPVTTVEIGTQVSGTIDSVFVDYNDIVREGQLLAVLDTAMLKASLIDAEAAVERVEAQLEQAEADYKRYRQLFEKELVSEADYLPYEINVKTQKAQLKSAKASLDRAQSNLGYAVITSPINGTVISKSVESGQTVAASFSTPTLFLIAENLSRMEILTEVDESDIGDIEEGQSVRFEVQTYSDEIFEGTVRQVRLQPTTISNVVTYTVVVDAENEEGLLLPGMTATVDFITESCENVLTVPNTALRFTPSDDVMQEAFEKHRAEAGKNRGDGGNAPPGRPIVLQVDKSKMRESMGQVWYLDDSGELAVAMFRKGITDGSNTEIMMSRDLSEGMEIISGYETGSTSTTSTETSDRKINPGMGGGPPPRGF